MEIWKIATAAILTAILMLSFAQANGATDAELPNQDKVLGFLNSVLQLDTTKYVVTPVSYALDYPTAYGGLAVGVGLLNLTTVGSQLSIDYTTINDTLVNCGLTVFSGKPFFTQEPKTVLYDAEGFLERYQNFADAAYVNGMPSMLNSVNTTKNATTVSGNIKLTVSNWGAITDVSWMYTSNGLDFPQKGVTISFRNGVFYSWGDDWNLFKIGTDSLQISKEQAVDIAMQEAKNFTFQVSQGIDNYTTVGNVSIDASRTEAFLAAGAKEPLTLYPLWSIQLYFDKPYNSYYGYQAAVWGDTGEVTWFNPTGHGGASSDMGGGQPTDNASNPQIGVSASPSSASQSQSNPIASEPPSQSIIYAIGIVAVVAIALIGVVMALKRRK